MICPRRVEKFDENNYELFLALGNTNQLSEIRKMGKGRVLTVAEGMELILEGKVLMAVVMVC